MMFNIAVSCITTPSPMEANSPCTGHWCCPLQETFRVVIHQNCISAILEFTRFLHWWNLVLVKQPWQWPFCSFFFSWSLLHLSHKFVWTSVSSRYYLFQSFFDEKKGPLQLFRGKHLIFSTQVNIGIIFINHEIRDPYETTRFFLTVAHMFGCFPAEKLLGSSFCPSVRRGPSFVRDPSGVTPMCPRFFLIAMKDVVRDHEIIWRDT